MTLPAKIEINGETYIKESYLAWKEHGNNQPLKSDVRANAKCKLRSIMIERGMNNGDLARVTGISYPTIKSYSDNASAPSVYKAQTIAKALGLSISDIWDVELS